MKKMKSISATTNETTQSNAPANAGIDPVPAVPAVPKGRPTAKTGRKGRRPKSGLIDAATGLVKELRDNADALRAELGPKTVDPLHLAAILEAAVGWSSAAADAKSFNVYARSQRGTAWDASLGLMGGMQLGVRYAIARDATFGERFPVTGKTFAPQKRSKKGDASTAAGDAAAKTPSPAKAAKSAAVAPASAAAETAPAEPSATPETSPAATTA